MQKVSLIALGRHHLEQAKRASSGRSAETVFGGHEHHLRQTIIALRSGESLAEHVNPGEVTVQVLIGRVLLRAGSAEWNGSPGDLLTVPDGRHALDAVDDSVILLTVVGRISTAGPERASRKDTTDVTSPNTGTTLAATEPTT